ncbi:MAG: Rid family hydrolase [Planctomycetota bacterium]
MFLEDPRELYRLRLPAARLRRWRGPEASEFFLRLRPACGPGGAGSSAGEAESIYRQLRGILAAQGASPEHVVQETVFFQNIARDLGPFSEARSSVLGETGSSSRYEPALVTVEQPPLDPPEGAGGSAQAVRTEALFHVVVPRDGVPASAGSVRGSPRCGCASCAQSFAKVVDLGERRHVFAGNLYGAPGSPFDEALSMFEVAEDLLERAGLDFRSVARTWIYLRDMERDYGEFNRARRTFFRRIGLELLPASTGINGGPFPPEHNYVFGFYAIAGRGPIEKSVMTTPTLNEAPEYGSDFSRGLAVADGNKRALYVSGTASVDEMGRTVHEDDFEAQVERMLLNVEKLLEGRGATFADMVSAVTYLKRASDAPALRGIFRERGAVGFPNAIVEAGVCRPDLLCEMEGIAVLSLG